MSNIADPVLTKSPWPVMPLGEICRLLNGRAYKKPELLAEGKYRVLRVGNFFTNTNWYFSDLELPPEKYCEKGDLLYAWSASFGPRIWRGEKVIYHYHIWRVDFDPVKAVRDFLYYFFLWDVEKIKAEQGAGTTMIHVTKGAMEQRLLAVPPLPEQERIVGILDEAFAGIATATAHAQRNLDNARELFQSVLQSTFEQKGEDWVETTLGDVSTKIGSGATPKGGQAGYKSEGIPLIRSLNVHDREFRIDKLAFIDGEQAEKLKNVIVEEGDVLLNITGASVARCCVAPTDQLPARVNQHVSIIRPIPELLKSSFLNLLLTSKEYKDRLLGIGHEGGSTRQAITKAQIQVFPLFLPSLAKQKAIVQKLDALSAETRRLEAIYERKLAALAELKQSLLQRAFAGQL